MESEEILAMFLISMPKKAVLSQTNLIKCLICTEVLETSDRIAVFGRLQWDLHGTLCKILGGELVFERGLAICLQKKMLPKVEKDRKDDVES